MHELPCHKCFILGDEPITDKFNKMQDRLAQITQEHANTIVRKFGELRARGILFDFEICVGNKKLNTHRVVLATSSDYFRAMFSQDSRELTTGKVFLQNIDADAVEAIIDYIYTGHIDLNENNIEDILLAASILQVQVIQEISIHFIKSKIDASNCLGVASLAERCNLLELNCKALEFCYDNFKQIVNEDEFLHLEESLLARLLSSDKLNVDDETEVFSAVLSWVEADKEQRIPKLDKVLTHVRFATLDPATLITLSSNNLVKTSPYCQDLIGKAKDYLLLKDFPDLQEEHAGDLVTTPRHSRRRIYVAGGVGQPSLAVGHLTRRFQSLAMAEVYDPKTDKWTDIKSMSENRCSVGVAALNHSIYAVGGHNGSAHLRSVERFDIFQNSWIRDVAPMCCERSSVAVVALNNFIYAIGGQAPGGQAPGTPSNGGLALDKVEKYNRATNTWETCQPLKMPRLGAGVAVLNGLIYVMGGSDNNFDEVHKTVEIYDPDTDTWTLGPSMSTPRKHFGCCSYSGLIFAVGGRNRHDGQLDSSEVFNSATNQWSEIPKMPRKRAGLGLVELDGLIYAIGGQNLDEKLNIVEVYDLATKTWYSRAPMKHCRLGAGVTVHPS